MWTPPEQLNCLLGLSGRSWAPTRANEEFQSGVGATDKKVRLLSAGLGQSFFLLTLPQMLASHVTDPARKQ